MRKNIFKIAVLQKKSLCRDYQKNTVIGLEEMNKASKLGADILLFPECFITSYNLPITNEEAISDESLFLKMFCENAKKLSMGVVITAFTKGKIKPQNSAFVINKQGKIMMKYNKVHTCDFADEKCLESGKEFKVCDFDGVKLGIMICYDREYPESARILMLKGAEIILVPNDCRGMKPRLMALSTRAYENMTGVVMANPPGKQAGCSCAFSPIAWDKEGNCKDMEIFIADELSEQIYIAEYDLDKLRNYRSCEMMGNTFRKVCSYTELLSSEVQAPFIRKPPFFP